MDEISGIFRRSRIETTVSVSLQDPIYGRVRLSDLEKQLISTPEFTSRKNISQLGALSLSNQYSSATHSRFSHLVGTCHAGKQVMSHLVSIQPQIFNDDDVMKLGIAGLCHDLGHGPFSHSFEQCFPSFNHEEKTADCLRYIVDKYSIPISGDDLGEIIGMITGNHRESPFYGSLMTSSILDIDKADYYVRDSHFTGYLRVPSNPLTVLKNTRFIDEELCYNESDILVIYQLLSYRYNMHKNVYRSRYSCGSDELLKDCLKEINKDTSIISQVTDLGLFFRLSDNILDFYQQSASEESELINRLKSGGSYYFIREEVFENQDDTPLIDEEVIISHCRNRAVTTRDIVVRYDVFDMGHTTDNFFDSIKVYSDLDIYTSFVPRQKTYGLMTCPKLEVSMKIYSKVSDPVKNLAISEATDRYFKGIGR